MSGFQLTFGWIFVVMVTTVAANNQLISTANSTQLIQSFSVPDSENNIAFDLPDLTATTEVQSGGEFQIEAFKSVHNDRILTQGSNRTVANQAVSELFWVSVGQPAFVKTSSLLTRNNQRPSTRGPSANSSSTTTTKLFHFTNSGFYTYVQTLTPADRRLLANTAQKKYRVNVTEDQIVHLILSRFECSLMLYDEADNKHLINGRVTDFRNFPLRMDFRAPSKSLSRKLFLDLLDTVDDQVDLHFQCQMASRGRMMRTNTLTISQQQIEQIELVDKLFGSASDEPRTAAYVTRNQMNELASEMYTALNIVEEYEMPEVEFNDAFISDLIRQLAEQYFTMVPLDSALQTLSKYGFQFHDDLSPDRIKRDLGSLLVIQRVDQKSKIVLNNSKYQQLTESSHSEGKVGVLEILGLDVSAQWARNNIQSSISEVKSLNDQLQELNQVSVNDVRWAVEGERVIPKKLNVARLSRGRLTRGLTFRKVRIQTYNAPFNREFGMYTLRAIQSPLLPSSVDRLTVKLSQLESLVDQQNISAKAVEGSLRASLLQLNTSLSSAWTQIGRKVRRCRVCFEARSDGPANSNWNNQYNRQQCGGQLNTCSGWSDSPQWSPEFLDNTDDREGWCWYKWKIECEL